jgi:hypothetical protein
MLDRIVETGSLVLAKVGGDRAGVVAIQRYLESPNVTYTGILDVFTARTLEACKGRRVVVAQDTTEINFSGRSAARVGLGPAGNGKALGFFAHPNIVVDADTSSVLGLAGAHIWTRPEGKVKPRHGRAAADKESARWRDVSQMAADAMVGHASQVIGVSDREGDVWDHFINCPPGMDQVVRARHKRPLDEGGHLFDALVGTPILASVPVAVAPQGIGDKGRTAQVELRAGTVRIKRPGSAPSSDPKMIELGFVEAIEVNPPEGIKKPLAWRLLTTLPVATKADAEDVIHCYRLRWRIEQLFRTLKSDGLALEDSQVHSADRLFRLTAMGLGSAVRIMQLVDARDGSERPMSDVLDEGLVEEVAMLVRAKEGATDRQKNPHPKASLAWLAWVVARYGGWNCYGKPPGPKTMASGWKTFSATLNGVIMAKRGGLA